MSAYQAAYADPKGKSSEGKLSLEKEGLICGETFLDYADIKTITPRNHRVLIETIDGMWEISMLGYSFDGFCKELTDRFGARALEALFVKGTPQMSCEGEYNIPGESGRCRIHLYPDSVCLLPDTVRARRIPLCFIDSIRENGYLITLWMTTGEQYTFGRMGYDTKPFFERIESNRKKILERRTGQQKALSLESPFTHNGLFRTDEPGSFMAVFGQDGCAVELKTQEETATYLYRFSGQQDAFYQQLCYAMEAVGTNREVIFIDEEKLQKKPVYRMTIDRTPAVSFLRAASAGRLIHNAGWLARLEEFLRGGNRA